MNAPLPLVPLIERTGWVLLHSLWQFALAALVAAALARVLCRRSAEARYALFVATLAAVAAAPVATAIVASRAAPVPPQVTGGPGRGDVAAGAARTAADWEPAGRMRNIADPAAPPDESSDGPSPSTAALTSIPVHASRPDDWSPRFALHGFHLSLLDRAREFLRPWQAWIVAAWVAGVLLGSARPLWGWRTLRRLTTEGLAPAGDVADRALCRMTELLGVRRAVRVARSALVAAPVVAGFARPIILLPVSLVTAIPVRQLEAILAHELAHVRRHDFVVNVAQTLVETLFFYHPAVWWLSRRIRVEREHCCDDLAVRALGDRAEYGRALIAIEELRGQDALWALGAADGSLLARVRRIARLDPSPLAPRRDAWPAAGPGLAALAVASALTLGWALAARDDAPQSAAATEPAPDAPRPAVTDDAPRTAPAVAARRRHANPLVAALMPPEPGARLDADGSPLPAGMVQRLGSRRHKVPGWWRRLTFAGDDEWIWIKANDRLSVLHRETGRVVKQDQLRLGDAHIWNLAASPNGTLVAVGMTGPPSDVEGEVNNRVVVFSARTTSHLLDLRWASAGGSAHIVSFSGDGRTLLTSMDPHHVLLWDMATGEMRRKVGIEGAVPRHGELAPDGLSAVFVDWEKAVIWKFAEGAQPIRLPNNPGDGLCFSPDGRWLATISPEGVRLRRAATGELAAFFTADTERGYADADFGISFTPDSRVLAVPAYQSNQIDLWDVETKERVASLPVPQPRGLAISRNGRWLAASGDEQFTTVFDLATRQPVNEPGVGHTREVYGMRYADIATLVTSSDGQARVWDLSSGKQQSTLSHESDWVNVRGTAASPDGRIIVTSAHDDTLGLWDRGTGQRLFTLKGHGRLGGTRVVRSTPDGGQVVSWGDDAVLRRWNVRDGTLAAAHALDLPGYVDPAKRAERRSAPAAAVSSDAETLFVVFRDRLFEFDTRTGKRLRDAPVYKNTMPLAVSADGRWIAAGETRRDEEGEYLPAAIVLRDRATLEVVREWPVMDPRRDEAAEEPLPADSEAARRVRALRMSFVGQNDNAMAFSPDSRRLAWSRIGPGSGIDVVDVEGGELVASIPVESLAWCLDFSPDGSRLASGHADSTAAVWDLAHPAFAPPAVGARRSPLQSLHLALRELAPPGWRATLEDSLIRFTGPADPEAAAPDRDETPSVRLWFAETEFTAEREHARALEQPGVRFPPVVRFGRTRLGFAHCSASPAALRDWPNCIDQVRAAVFAAPEARAERSPVRIRVVDAADGAPIPGITVEAVRWHDPRDKLVETRRTTGESGTVEFRGLWPMRYHWRVRGEAPYDPIPDRFGSDVDEGDVVLRFKKACRLVLRAVDAETGRGVPGATFGREQALGEMWLHPVVADTLGARPRSPEDADPVTDNEGRYECLVTPDTWSYSVYRFPPGYKSIEPIAGRQEVELEAPPGGQVEHTFRLRRTQAE